jgi:calcium/calmodulin-dependent protein kinase I
VTSKYVIENKELGKGAYAVVKLGTDKKTKRKVAVKIVDRTKLSKEDEIGMKEEVRILRKLDHSGVVRCFDFYEEPKLYFLIMELVEGGELFERIVKKSTYNEKEARNAVRIMLTAIKYCHDNNVVHRCGNITTLRGSFLSLTVFWHLSLATLGHVAPRASLTRFS